MDDEANINVKSIATRRYETALATFIQSYEKYLTKIREFDYSYNEIISTTGTTYLSNLITITKEVAGDDCRKKCDSVSHCAGYSFDVTSKTCRIYGDSNAVDNQDGHTHYKRGAYSMISAWNDVVDTKTKLLRALDALKEEKQKAGAKYTLDELYDKITMSDDKRIADVLEIET